MSLSKLEWDSNFFQLKVGKVEQLGNQSMLMDILNDAKRQGFDLVYYFENQETKEIPPTLLTSHGGKKIDTKVIFQWSNSTKKDTVNFSTIGNIELYKEDVLREDLLELAYRSGIYSRFKLDSLFGIKHFKLLYRAWLKNSIEKKIADYVFIKKNENEIIGFVTFKKKANNWGEIGLIAVSEHHSNQGIGKQLINKIKETTINLNLDGFKVATQKDNLNACKFYEKNNCQIIHSTQIYHFWLKHEYTFQ